MREPRAGWVVLALLTLAVALGLTPFLPLLPLHPAGSDAFVWTQRAHPDSEGWLEWAVASKHFVGYRPVTALSFSLNGWLTGDRPWGLRLTDLLLHVGAGLGVFAAWGALTKARWSPWGLLAAAVFWSHPVGQSVVPFLARRSYSLATALGLLALALWLWGARRGRPGLLWAGAASLFAALLANETAFVLVPVLGLLAVSESPGRRAALRSLAPVLAVMALAVGLRTWVLGGLGGYRQELTAVVEGGRRSLVQASSPADLLLQAWSTALAPTSPGGEAGWLLASGGLWVVLLLGVAGLAWSADRLRRGEPLPMLLVVWATGYAVLVVVSGTWFWRQAYPMVVPVALWLTLALKAATEGPRTVAGGVGVLALLLLSVQLQHGTPWGLDREPIRGRFRHHRVVTQALAAVEGLEGPGRVLVAVPLRGPMQRSALRWIRSSRADLQVRLLAEAHGERTLPRVGLELVDEGGVVALRPGRNMRWSGRAMQVFGLEGRQDPLPVEAIGDHPTWIVGLKGPGAVRQPDLLDGSVTTAGEGRKRRRQR